jgi:hypothetical protein
VGAKLGFRDSLKKSTVHFEELIKPLLEKYRRFKNITSVEANSTEQLADMLDQTAGIDAFFCNDTGLGGIASRIQPNCYKSFDTFTVRKSRESGAKTEYEKRKAAIDSRGELIYPYYTLQAYLGKQEELISYAIAKTEDIINLIDDGECYVNHTGQTQKGQAEFYVVNWTSFEKNNKPIYIYRHE